MSILPTQSSRLPVFPPRQAVFLVISTVVVQSIALYFCLKWFGVKPDGGKAKAELMTALTTIPTAIGIAWIWLFAVFGEARGWRGLGMVRPDHVWRLWAVAAGVALLFVNILITLFVRPIFGPPAPLPFGGEGGLAEQSVLVIAMFFLGAVVLAPILEELVFRAIFFARLRSWFGFLPAAAIAGFAHALLHFDPATIPGLTVVFIAFAYLYERSGSLWVPITAHGVHNFLVAVSAMMQAG